MPFDDDETLAGGDDWKAYKGEYDRRGKVANCFRCGAKGPLAHRITESASTPRAVIQQSHWLCPDCSKALSRFFGEVRAERQAGQPGPLEALRSKLAPPSVPGGATKPIRLPSRGTGSGPAKG